jgi:hypothetical protein
MMLLMIINYFQKNQDPRIRTSRMDTLFLACSTYLNAIDRFHTAFVSWDKYLLKLGGNFALYLAIFNLCYLTFVSVGYTFNVLV